MNNKNVLKSYMAFDILILRGLNMRLFHQLTEDERHDAMHYCMDEVLDNIICGDIKLSVDPEDDAVLSAELQTASDHIKTLEEDEDKVDYLMNNEKISSIIFDLASNMAHSAYYHSSDEYVIYPDQLRDDQLTEGEDGHICEHHDHGEEEISSDVGFSAPSGNKSKKPHSLN